MSNVNGSHAANSPVKVTWQEGTSRLMNLVIALTHSPHPRPFTWIRQHVEGYGLPAEEGTAKRQFDRDRVALAKHAGIILTEHSVDSGFGATKEAVKGWSWIQLQHSCRGWSSAPWKRIADDSFAMGSWARTAKCGGRLSGNSPARGSGYPQSIGGFQCS